MPANTPSIAEQHAYRDCAEGLRNAQSDARLIADAVQRIEDPHLRAELLVPKR